MLKSISWQEFLTVLFVIAVVYYVVLGLFYYGSEIKQFFFRRRSNDPDISKDGKKQRSTSLVGKVKDEELIDDQDTNQETLSSDQLHLANNSPQDVLLGTVADLLKDLKHIIESIIANRTDKQESLLLIRSLLAKYPQLVGTSYQRSIDLFLYENALDQFSFDLTLEDIRSLWTK